MKCNILYPGTHDMCVTYGVERVCVENPSYILSVFDVISDTLFVILLKHVQQSIIQLYL
jgi:hypothetical protein